MKPTHYELLINGKVFPAAEIFDDLKNDLPHEGFTFEQFIQSGFMKEVALQIDPSNERDMTANAQILFHAYSYHIGMGRTYEVTEPIAEMLLNTKLDVDIRLVKSPFTEIQIVVPPLLKLYNNITGMHDIWCIYVNFHETSDTDKLIKILCVGKANEKSMHELDDALFYFKVPLTEGKVSENLKRELENWHIDPNYGRFSCNTTYDEHIIPRLFYFVLNILLYITSEHSDIRFIKSPYEDYKERLGRLKSSGKIKKLERRMEKESKISRYVIGSSIKLSSEETDLYDAVKRAGPRIRFPVGGHWRMQWVGHKNEQTQKLTWVRPYLKGPEIAELIKNIGTLK